MGDTKRRKDARVAVIGAGSAGISAFRQLRRSGADAVLIDPGPLGTMCARTGCMPSKALISVANDYHRRAVFDREGIRGADGLSCDLPEVLEHVRKMRDRFTAGMVQTTEKLAGNRLIRERATLVDKNMVDTAHYRIHAEKIIIATGARPRIPEAWRAFGERVLTSETLFEQKNLPRRLAVIGLKLEGLELGQALARLGVDVVCFGRNKNIGGVTDPEVNEALHHSIGSELTIYSNAEAEVKQNDDGSLTVEAGDVRETVDALLLCMGVVPNLSGLGLERLGIDLNEKGRPSHNPKTGQIGDLPIYLAGDVSGYRPILHEALDEGFIAGFNTTAVEPMCADRRVPLRICFTDPQVVVVGKSWDELKPDDVAVGSVDFADASRAVLEHHNVGFMRVYADPETGRLLGSEMAAPEAEHLGHLIALAIQQQMSVNDLLMMPFYHPTHTEALRTALRDAARKCPIPDRVGELSLHDCSPESPLM